MLSLSSLLSDINLTPISEEIGEVCSELEDLKIVRKGKKQYDTMVAAYFRDMAKVLQQTSRVMQAGSRACFVIGDSAPYGVYVPVDKWLSILGEHFGLKPVMFEQTRERNMKWKNRKHRVPLKEGRLWFSK